MTPLVSQALLDFQRATMDAARVLEEKFASIDDKPWATPADNR